MLYYLAKYLDRVFDFPGAGMFEYISFRAGAAVITSLIISMIFGRQIINFLRRKQVGETVRDLNLPGQKEKEGTPTMGGLIIILAIVIPTLLFAKLDNIYIIVMLVTTVWLGFIGFLDDYIKVFKKNKNGLAGKFKVVGQVLLGVFVGIVVYCHPDIVVRDHIRSSTNMQTEVDSNGAESSSKTYSFSEPKKDLETTIPFVKNHELNYKDILWFVDKDSRYKWAWLIFIPIVILIVVAVSNCANLTDGIDGLATGTSAIIGATLGIFAWVSGNAVFADYLDIMMIPNVGELTIFVAAFVGACIGFLWYNTNPAQVFMGDTGSLCIGGIIAVFAILIRKELLLPILCGIFVIEGLSVIIQTSWFKFTKKRYGVGRRVFRMSPLHHHFQQKKMPEQKIVMRFFIVGIILAVFTLVTLKIR
ncbi:phospho-N-acetylmuramoyl-pentapeptide-transferase [Odoribacter sp. OttesenSCG-928-L07]|nr:phospho-N-acetylmuramoyl-pentapeptide-transferase [Odoribacter sp. OttesenSCG-928-L07]MDL2239193.1 phospho-N-acetylmuramoyl-pentapeptide-transferase [Bacteroidales bacterium OttesenSCG-928-L14]MDL2240537.1 phospho-N-acetylmuramoyl-pentapeptide-transferase [Bacteroidales bacterium OttesenSCG-928-K22]